MGVPTPDPTQTGTTPPSSMSRDIRFLRITHLRGPNIWTYRPTLEAWIDIGDLEAAHPTPCPAFTNA